MSAHGELALNAPVAVNISTATDSDTPALLMLPARKLPDKTLLVPLVGVTTHCRARRMNVTVWSSGAAASTTFCVASRRRNDANSAVLTAINTMAATPIARIISISVNACILLIQFSLSQTQHGRGLVWRIGQRVQFHRVILALRLKRHLRRQHFH